MNFHVLARRSELVLPLRLRSTRAGTNTRYARNFTEYYRDKIPARRTLQFYKNYVPVSSVQWTHRPS